MPDDRIRFALKMCFKSRLAIADWTQAVETLQQLQHDYPDEARIGLAIYLLDQAKSRIDVVSDNEHGSNDPPDANPRGRF